MLRFTSQKASQEHPEQFTSRVMTALVLKQVLRSGLALGPQALSSLRLNFFIQKW